MNPDAEMVERLNAASHDERLSTGALYREAAALIESQSSRIATLQRDFDSLIALYGQAKADLAAAREALERIARSDYRGNMPSEVAMARAVLDAARNAGKGGV